MMLLQTNLFKVKYSCGYKKASITFPMSKCFLKMYSDILDSLKAGYKILHIMLKHFIKYFQT